RGGPGLGALDGHYSASRKRGYRRYCEDQSAHRFPPAQKIPNRVSRYLKIKPVKPACQVSTMGCQATVFLIRSSDATHASTREAVVTSLNFCHVAVYDP